MRTAPSGWFGAVWLGAAMALSGCAGESIVGAPRAADAGGDIAMDIVTDVPPVCMTGQTVCSNACVNTQTDNANCGACGNSCIAGQMCALGRCAVTCGATLATCTPPDAGVDGGSAAYCADLANDRFNCGACGLACPPGNICVNRMCQVSCVAGQTLCGGTCRDLQSDVQNCGGCGMACAAGQVCSSGACAASCGPGLHNCSGACVSTDTDPANCGACGNTCRLTNVSVQACVAGACVVGSCTAGWADCDGMASDGCETNVRSTDVANCGGCGIRCAYPNAAATCTDGVCMRGACAAGFADCDGDPSNGCEANTQTDNAHCGACTGSVCASGQVCNAGACATTCGAGLTNCSGDCVNRNTDVNNCGACATVCALPNVNVQACSGGACVVGGCATGFGDCDAVAANGCETNVRSTDVANCGGCGVRCGFANAAATCMGGTCVLGACNTGFADCDGNPANGCEVNTQSDNVNCGACSTTGASHACAGGQVCSGGACAASCGAGRTNCSGDCVNLATDPNNCGACASVCNLAGVSVQACSGSACVVGGCIPGLADCNRTASDGCEVNVASNNVNNCGGCGVRCSFPNAAATCAAGACVRGACNTGFADCDGNPANGCEVNTTTDNGNCGACSATGASRACAAGQVCSAGACAATCGAGLTACSGRCVSTTTDPANCGTCGTVCALASVTVNTCVAGACAVGTCAVGRGDCDRVASNGCETVTNTTDVNNCGGCAVRCSFPNATATCAAGSCVRGACAAGFADCNGVASDGCEVNVNTDSRNCGACNLATASHVCAAGQVCNAGTCAATCASGLTDCGGTCRNLSADPLNCNGCGTICPSGGHSTAFCTGSTCGLSCAAGFADCNATASDGCERSTTTLTDCGACNRACSFANAAGICSTSGVCSMGACNTGFADCNGNPADGCEVNLATDRAHCGACTGTSATCASGQVCNAGTCAASCGAGLTQCGGGCTNTQYDPANCNACSVACPAQSNARAACAGGACGIICNSGFGNCNGVDTDGCETPLTSVTNCGGCGIACTSAQSCTAGVCTYLPNYTFSVPSSAPAFVDACAAAGSVHLLASTDDAASPVTLPFAFAYWGSLIASGSTIYASTNGNLQMAGPGSGQYTPLTIPSATDAANGTIAAHWHDIFTRTNGICIATTGTAPSRSYIAEWADTYNWSTSQGDMTFEIVLHETSMVIDFVYSTMSATVLAGTTGLETVDGLRAIVPPATTPNCNGTGTDNCSPATGTAYRFTPSP